MSSRYISIRLFSVSLFLVLVMTTINPGYMSVLLHDPRGHYVIAVAIALQITGMLLIKKILDIRV